MSVSETQIAKLALQHIGDRYDITTLDEDTPEAEQVNLVFDNVRDALLAEFPWKFSKAYTSPAKLAGTPPAQWENMYAYPPDALKVWKIVNPLGRDNYPPIPFDILRNSNDVKVLVTNTSEPEFEYAKKITNTGEFSPHFVLALSWRIAAMIAMPLTGSTEVRDRVRQEADIAVATAKEEDGNEGVAPVQSRDPDWIRARGTHELNTYPWWSN